MPNLLGRRIPTSAILQSAPRVNTGSSIASVAPRLVGTAPTKDSGIGDVLASLGKTFQNGTVNALRQEQLTKLATANEWEKRVIGAIGADGGITNQQDASIASALGAMDPTKFARMGAIRESTLGGVDSPKAAQFLNGLGEYKNTSLYGEREFANKVEMQGLQEQTKLAMNDAQEATKVRLKGMELVQADGPNGPQYVPTSEAKGMAPILGMDQQRAQVASKVFPGLSLGEQKVVTGVAPMSPELYVGTTASGTVPVSPAPGGGFINAQTNEMVTEPMSSVGKLLANSNDGLKPTDEPNRTLRDAQVSTTQALSAIGKLQEDLTKPNAGAAMGAVGSVASGLNYIRAQTEAAAKVLNPKNLGFRDEMGAEDVTTTLDNAFRSNAVLLNKAQQLGIDHAVLRSQIQNLAYVIAKSNDPGGKTGVQDVQSAIDQIGGSLGDPVAMSAVLGNLGQSIKSQYEAKDSVFRRTYGGKIAVPRLEGSTNAPVSSPSAAPAQEETWVRGPDGKLTRGQ